MRLLDSLITKHEERVRRRNEESLILIADISVAIKEKEEFFSKPDKFINIRTYENWIDKNTALKNRILNLKKYKRTDNYADLMKISITFNNIWNNLKQEIYI